MYLQLLTRTYTYLHVLTHTYMYLHVCLSYIAVTDSPYPDMSALREHLKQTNDHPLRTAYIALVHQLILWER